MPTFSLHTLGCRANQADSERLRQILLGAGFTEVPFGQAADCAVVNTCTVTREADRKSLQFLRRAGREAETVVAAGCAVAPRGGVRNQPEGTLRFPPEGGDGHLEHLGASSCPSSEAVDGEARQVRSRALLKVQDGCDQFCSFCIVPYVRGRSRSLPADNLLDRVRHLEALGYREVVLTGIQLAAWGRDLPGQPDLADLLDGFFDATSEVRFRLSSLEPQNFPRRLLDRMVHRPDRVCPHLHLALQHASDKILARMRRGYELAHYDGLAREFLRRVPGACLTTDVMVGFPGETPEDFATLLRYVRGTPFYRLHVFPYSPRAGTAAFRLPDGVPAEEKRRRVGVLLALDERKRRDFARAFRGSTRLVLIEQVGEGPGQVVGTTDNYLPVVMRGGHDLLGRVVPVVLGRRRGERLTGRAPGQEFPGGFRN